MIQQAADWTEEKKLALATAHDEEQDAMEHGFYPETIEDIIMGEEWEDQFEESKDLPALYFG